MMANNIPTGRKIPLPRRLDKNETAASLRLWRVHFCNYYKNDVYFSRFVTDTATWHIHQPNWGFEAEAATSVLKRTAEEVKSDCSMFLDTLSSFVPDDYLVEKIVKNTSKLANIWTILEDYFGVALNSETYLGLAKMQKLPTETYRQFYLRMEGFVSKHLTKGNVKVEEITTPARGDVMTISIKNILVILWMTKIHERLIDCIRIEFAQELRAGRELIELMTRIADNVDSILARHDISSGVSHIEQEEGDGDLHRVNRINFRGGQRGRGAGRGDGRGQDGRDGRRDRRDQDRRDQYRSGPGKTLECSHCKYLAQTLKLKINTSHEPDECYRKDIAVRLIRGDRESEESYSSAEDQGEKLIITKPPPNNVHALQSEESYPASVESAEIRALSNSSSTAGFKTPPLSDHQDQFQQILKIQRSLINSEVGTAQAKSPSLTVSLHGHRLEATLDEGSELNCLSLKVAKKCNLAIEVTANKARAADSSRLRLVGQLKKPLLLVAEPHGTPIRLKHVVVIDQLNADILIGEPGKKDNDIVTYPSQQKISIPFKHERHVYTYSHTRGPVSKIARIPESTVTYPGENYFWPVPEMYSQLSHLQIQPRLKSQKWFQANTCQVQNGNVCLKNTSPHPIFLKKGSAFADIRMVGHVDKPVMGWEELSRAFIPELIAMEEEDLGPDMGQMRDITDILSDIPATAVEEACVGAVLDSYPDQSQYVSTADKSFLTVDHTDKVQLDPDNILNPAQKTEFRRLLQEFKDVIRPEPGKYNGRYGHIDNRINWGSKPAPNQKIYQQNLTEEMKKQLGAKMDKLMSWGVLQFPEHSGVRPEFISPSMLVPKQEKGEFRLITNFSSLNKFIKKPRGTAPTIQEAKDFLAKFDLHIHLDLSNFFYQSGLDRKDMQYLGTVHPYKGIVLYSCEGQGINGAPEHSYERITRIFSDFFEEGSCTRMADGLHIGCNTVEAGTDILRRILQRARDSGLTFKPSKIEIFPKTTILFGWKLSKGLWSPTVHTTSALAKAPLPKTVKQLRSFLGSYKQFTNCVQRYGEILTQLEGMTGSHIPGAEVLQWTKSQEEAFYAARESTKTVDAFAIPRPSDKIYTYSDFSRAHRAVGGKMEFERVMEDGKVKRFLGGYFSVMVDSFKSQWWPCEGEALAARLVLEFFERYIREADTDSVHYTDNQPVVDAWKKARRGGFSTNARISTFLAAVANFPIEIRHKAGALMLTSDYASRHPQVCPDKTCSLCKFAYQEQMIGDNCDLIRQITVEEVLSGEVTMPLTARRAWLEVQAADPVHIKLKYLIEVGQEPHKKQTKGDANKLKLLYNLYGKGDLRVEKDGLVTVRQHGPSKSAWVTSIPYKLFPGLSQALHLKFSHPSKNQLVQLMSRYFYTPGHQAIIEETVNSCSVCLSMKILPKVLKEHQATPVEALGARFSTDVMMRAAQKFLVTVESQSGFTWVSELEDQAANSIKLALLEQIMPIMPETGTTVRSDGASSFKSLELESDQVGSIWKKHNIKFELGHKHNPNKNAQAENKIRETEKEFLRHCPAGGKVTKAELVEIVRTLNSRIRQNGLASREVLLSRRLITNEMMDLTSRDLAEEKKLSRDDKNQKFLSQQKRAGIKEADPNGFNIGDLVFLRCDGDKNNTREQYIIHHLYPDISMASVKKYNSQLQAKNYKVKISELILNSNFRGPLKSADMSKAELEDRDHIPKLDNYDSEKKKEVENKNEKKEKKAKKKKKKMKSLEKENDSNLKTCRYNKGAPDIPQLNAAGRPMRTAARVATKANALIRQVVDDNDVKLPWLQEDQLSEDEDDFVVRVHLRPDQDLAAVAPHGVHHQAEDLLLQHPEAVPLLVADIVEDHELDLPAAVAPLRAGIEYWHELIYRDQLAIDYVPMTGTEEEDDNPVVQDQHHLDPDVEGNHDQVADDVSTASSDYYDLSPHVEDKLNNEEYEWEEDDEELSFSSQKGASASGPFPQCPRDWPPRRLSSEISTQMIVTQLVPPENDFDQYFIDSAFTDDDHQALVDPSINSPPPEDDITAAASSTQSVPSSPAASVDESENTDPDYHPSDVSDSEILSPPPSIQLESEADTNPAANNQPPGPRQSSRLRQSDKPDYRRLNSQGRQDQI